MHGRPPQIDSGIECRLSRKLVFIVYQGCVARQLYPGFRRLEEHVNAAIRSFVADYSDVGDDEDDDANPEAALLANYYEDNWNGEIENEAMKTILSEMHKQGVERDAESDEKSIREECGSAA